MHVGHATKPRGSVRGDGDAFHVSFLEKLTKSSTRRRRRAIRETPCVGAPCRRLLWRCVWTQAKVECFVPTTSVYWRSRVCAVIMESSSRSGWWAKPEVERDGRWCARASEPAPAPPRPALISLPAAGKRFACAAPCRSAAAGLRRTRIFLDNSSNYLFTS